MTIRVTLRSVDGFRKSRSFKSIKGARAFAQSYVGKHPTIGSGYAVSDDGVATIYVSGCTLAALFSDQAQAPTEDYSIEATWDGYEDYYRVLYGKRVLAVYDTIREAQDHIGMAREHDAYVEQDSQALRDLERPF